MKKEEEEPQQRFGESSDLARVLTEDLRAAVSVARSTISSLEPDEIDEQVLVDVAKGALADLDAAVERWAVLHELEEEGGAIELVEPRGIVDDVLRGLLPELEEKELRTAVDDETGFREALIDGRRLAVALRGILDAVIAEASRGEEISIAIRFALGGPRESVEREIGARIAEHLVIETVLRCARSSAPSVGRPAGSEPGETPARMRASDRRKIGLVVAKRLLSGRHGTVLDVNDPGRGKGFAVWLPIDR